MPVFIGEFNYTIDEKGRVNIPAKFRKNMSPQAQDTFIIMRSKAGCLDVYPQDIFEEKVLSKIEKMSHTDAAQRYYMSFIGANSSDSQLDSQGRIAIPQKLLAYAGISKEIKIIGAFNRIELWNPARHEAYLKENEAIDSDIDLELLP